MNTLSIQLVCLVAFTFFIVCFRMLGVGFKPFAAGMLVIMVVWGITALVSLFTFVRLGVGGNLASLSVGGVIASVMAFCFFAWLGLTVFQASQVPSIHNISTDISNPPAFEKIPELRAPSHNPLEYTAEVAEQQRQHYAHIQPLVLSSNKEQVFDTALLVVDQLGWRLHHHNPKTGVIEASASSGIFGFVDDMVIRIEARETGTIVDMRSVSRVGKSDFGANAKRISQFLKILAAQSAN